MPPLEVMGPREVLFRIGAATLIGALLGLNRELRDKPAGLKTHALVSLGAALLVVISINIATVDGRVDAASVTRVVQGIITGIGFLGGGVILHQETSRTVFGLTTAASVWIAACLGIACGAGQWMTSAIAAGATLLVLILGERAEEVLHRRLHGDHQPPTTD